MAIKVNYRIRAGELAGGLLSDTVDLRVDLIGIPTADLDQIKDDLDDAVSGVLVAWVARQRS